MRRILIIAGERGWSEHPPLKFRNRFKRIAPSLLETLLEKGRRDAEELDKAIRDQFTLGPEANLRLR